MCVFPGGLCIQENCSPTPTLTPTSTPTPTPTPPTPPTTSVVECGPNNKCKADEVCCNESCGICAPLGELCSEQYCCPTPSSKLDVSLCYYDETHSPIVC